MLETKALFGGACYSNVKTRKWLSIGLLLSSYDMFHDSKIINNLEHLNSSYSANEASLRKVAPVIFSINNPVLEISKMGICFENYFKVELLLKGYIVHNIDKKVSNRKYKHLSKKQSIQPVKISDIKKAEGLIGKKDNSYGFESLLKTTILFSTLLKKPAYKRQLRFPDKLFEILERIHKVRNRSHFLLDSSFTYSQSVITDYSFLKSIVNNRLVKKHNSLCKHFGFDKFAIKKR